jgi:hypothetical protein
LGTKCTAGTNDLATLLPEIAAQWHPVKNGDRTPDTVQPGSNFCAYWRCEKGHEWKAKVYSRTLGSGCPICSGKKVVYGTNDLATLRPEIAKQWHSTKNGYLRPEDVTPFSNRKVWWICSREHEWMASINSRGSSTRYGGCPFCSNRRVLSGYNDIGSQYPELKLQWHPTKNGKLTPEEIIAGSKRKVWWICKEGHEWESSVYSRIRGNTDCPVCKNKIIQSGFNDLASLRPDLAAEWHPTKNGSLLPTEVSLYSNRKIWWRDAYGHEWKTTPSDRISRGSGCPYCAGRKVLPGFNDLATVSPELAEEWFYPLNHGLTPKDVTVGCRKVVWWKASCGHAWKAPVARRAVSHSRCPFCYGKCVEKKLQEYEKMYEEEMGLLLKAQHK